MSEEEPKRRFKKGDKLSVEGRVALVEELYSNGAMRISVTQPIAGGLSFLVSERDFDENGKMLVGNEFPGVPINELLIDPVFFEAVSKDVPEVDNRAAFWRPSYESTLKQNGPPQQGLFADQVELFMHASPDLKRMAHGLSFGERLVSKQSGAVVAIVKEPAFIMLGGSAVVMVQWKMGIVHRREVFVENLPWIRSVAQKDFYNSNPVTNATVCEQIDMDVQSGRMRSEFASYLKFMLNGSEGMAHFLNWMHQSTVPVDDARIAYDIAESKKL